MHITVERSPDERGDWLPRRLFLDGREVAVAEVVDRWSGRDHAYFKLKGDDGNVYIVRLDESRGDWELTMFETAGPHGVAGQLLPTKPRRAD